MKDRQRQKLLYYCSKRGTKENELVLRRFAEKHLDHLTESQLDALESLLACTDPQLDHWLSHPEDIPHEYKTDVFQMVLEVKNAGV